MLSKKVQWLLAALVIFALVLGACTTSEEPAEETAAEEPAEVEEPAQEEETVEEVEEPADETGLQIPDIEEGMFNVAFVYLSPIGDGGWTYAHNQGREYLEANVDGVHTAYIEFVAEGADSDRVIRNLARKGFDAVIATSFGYGFGMPDIAAEFPDVAFLHVSGFLKNDSNFGNMMGAMEDMKFLAGMVAGARAMEDGSNRVGFIAPWPIAEVIRLGNALVMGVRETCPECVVDVRWIFTWFDPDKEIQAAESLMDAGATVVVTGADTPGPVQAAGERGLWGVAYDSDVSCEADVEHCLTVPYWNWGVPYAQFAEEVMAGTWQPDDWYFDADTGGLGLRGFGDKWDLNPNVPEWVVPLVEEKMEEMLSGEFDRFDLFTGPIYDNKGNLVVPEGVTLTQEDLEGLDQAAIDSFGLDREACTICMNWLVEGHVEEAEIPAME